MDKIIDVRNLSVKIGKRTLMDNISFGINEGDAVLFSGANGTGKSTLLKSILRLEMEDKQIEGEIYIRNFGDSLKLDGSELQRLRASVAYVQQKDEFAGMGSVQVRDIISESADVYSGRTFSTGEINDLIDEWIPRREDNSRIFHAKSKPAKLSGGEQRLLSVLSVIATRPNTELMIIDEPLNNLDFANIRNVSNLLNKVVNENKKMGLLMVSHCRIFPFINREIKLTTTGIEDVSENYVCYSCFGKPDVNGFY